MRRKDKAEALKSRRRELIARITGKVDHDYYDEMNISYDKDPDGAPLRRAVIYSSIAAPGMAPRGGTRSLTKAKAMRLRRAERNATRMACRAARYLGQLGAVEADAKRPNLYSAAYGQVH